MKKKVVITFESTADNADIKTFFENKTKDNFRFPVEVSVEDLE